MEWYDDVKYIIQGNKGVSSVKRWGAFSAFSGEGKVVNMAAYDRVKSGIPENGYSI
jgi:hypothetical protein